MISQSKRINREQMIVLLSILVTIISTVVLSARRIALYDYNYIANSVHRMSLGEVPYRDFDLVLPPVTFMPVYLFHNFVGLGINTSILLCAIGTQIIALLSFYSILRRLIPDRRRTLSSALFYAALLSASLVNVISAYPNYIYDSLASSLALFTLALLLRYVSENQYRFLVLSLFFALLTFFTKFNMGGSLILGAVVVRVVTLIKLRQVKKLYLEALTFLILSLAFIVMLLIAGVSQFMDQTVIAPSKFKGVTKLGQLAQYNYPVLIAMLALIILALKFKTIVNHLTKYTFYFLFLSLSFSAILILFTPYSAEDKIGKIFPSAAFSYPIVMLLALHRLLAHSKYRIEVVYLLTILPIFFFGTFLSQGWNGSSYSLNPLLILLLVTVFITQDDREISGLRTITVSVVVLLTMNFLILSSNGNRLGYVTDNGARGSSFNWSQMGTALNADDVTQATEVRAALNLGDQSGSIVEFPAEDSLEQFSTKLTPWGRCLQFTFICPTKTDQDILNDFKNNGPSFVVLKRITQINRDIEPVLGILEPIVNQCLVLEYSNKNYEVFKKNAKTESCISEKLSTVNE